MTLKPEVAMTFSELQQAFATWTPSTYVEHPYVAVAAIAWGIVAFLSGWAVFSPRVRDTFMERVALVGISLGSLSRVFFVIGRGEIPWDGVLTAVSIAFYCCTIYYKNKYVVPQRRQKERDGTAGYCGPNRRASRKK